MYFLTFDLSQMQHNSCWCYYKQVLSTMGNVGCTILQTKVFKLKNSSQNLIAKLIMNIECYNIEWISTLNLSDKKQFSYLGSKC